jgi:sestrin
MQDFNWSNHAFMTVGQLYDDVASRLLDDKFRMIKSLTYMTIGRYTEVDTTMFRLAVRNYIQCLFGIRHDDYDYGRINTLLAR